MFDYAQALQSSNEYLHMKAYVTAFPDYPWSMQGALATIQSNASAATLFFYNSDDYYKDDNKNPQGLYASQAALMKARMDAVGATAEIFADYGSGHAVPQTTQDLQRLYEFLQQYVNVAIPCDIVLHHRGNRRSIDAATYNLMGCKVRGDYKGIVIRQGRKYVF